MAWAGLLLQWCTQVGGVPVWGHSGRLFRVIEVCGVVWYMKKDMFGSQSMEAINHSCIQVDVNVIVTSGKAFRCSCAAKAYERDICEMLVVFIKSQHFGPAFEIEENEHMAAKSVFYVCALVFYLGFMCAVTILAWFGLEWYIYAKFICLKSICFVVSTISEDHWADKQCIWRIINSSGGVNSSRSQ